MDKKKYNNVLDLRSIQKDFEQREEEARDIKGRQTDDEVYFSNKENKTPKIKLYILKGIVDDFIFSLLKLFSFKKEREMVNFVSESKNTNSFSYLMHLLKYLYLFVLYILKILKIIVLFPIILIDKFLDFIAKFVYLFIKYFVQLFVYFLKSVYLRLKTYIDKMDFSPPYHWYKSISVFIIISILLIVPVKLYYLKDKVGQAKGEVLGVSVKIAKYSNVFYYLKDYVPLVPVVRYFTGLDEPRNILILFQNNAELRPTGGFLGSYAYLTVKKGQIKYIEIPEGGFYDLKGYLSRKIAAPLPFHIFSPYWQVWNANWFADFPTSAEKIIDLYEISGGESVDGIISITPDVVEGILDITGPIEVREGLVIDKNNFRYLTQEEVEINYDKVENTPKKFIKVLFVKVLDTVIEQFNDKSGAEREDYIKRILYVFDKNIKEKNILLYARDEFVQNKIQENGLGGELKNIEYGNFLSVVHTNIGGGKSDLVIKNRIKHNMYIKNDEIISEVYLSRTHNGKEGQIFYGVNNLDYVRFYVPKGSILIEAKGFLSDDMSNRFKGEAEDLKKDDDLMMIYKSSTMDAESKTEIYTETEKTVFANWISLKPGQSKTVYIKYATPLPDVEDKNNFIFYWQKQAGDMNTYLEANISFSDDFDLKTVIPEKNVAIGGNSIKYINDLRQDRVLGAYVEY